MASNNRIRSHRDLGVYQRAFAAAMEIFELSRRFPPEERYALTTQIRRSSRSVCPNTAEAWRKRRYEGAWIAKLSDAETEAAETQVWLEFSVKCRYITRDIGLRLYNEYNQILGKLVVMINNPKVWIIQSKEK